MWKSRTPAIAESLLPRAARLWPDLDDFSGPHPEWPGANAPDAAVIAWEIARAKRSESVDTNRKKYVYRLTQETECPEQRDFAFNQELRYGSRNYTVDLLARTGDIPLVRAKLAAACALDAYAGMDYPSSDSLPSAVLNPRYRP